MRDSAAISGSSKSSAPTLSIIVNEKLRLISAGTLGPIGEAKDKVETALFELGENTGGREGARTTWESGTDTQPAMELRR